MTFALNTPDPLFDPHAPVTVNGYVYLPVPERVRDCVNSYLRDMAARGFEPVPMAEAVRVATITCAAQGDA